jgi:hypothetical protein
MDAVTKTDGETHLTHYTLLVLPCDNEHLTDLGGSSGVVVFFKSCYALPSGQQLLDEFIYLHDRLCVQT